YLRYQLPGIQRVESTDRSLHRYASVLPLQPGYAQANGVETLDGWANLYPSELRNFWLSVLAPLFENRPEEKAIFAADGGKPQDNFLFLGSGSSMRHDNYAGAVLDVHSRFNLSLLSLMNVRYVLSYYPLTSVYLDSNSMPEAPYAEFMNWSMTSGRLDTGTTRTPPFGFESMLRGL